VKRAIESVLKQSFLEWELLIIDDGSDDNTYSIARKLIANNGNIRYLFHKNRKLPLSLNAGIKASIGKHITFLGSDDEYKEDHLKLRIDFLTSNPDVDFLQGGLEIIGDPFVKDKFDLSKKIHINDCVVGGTFFAKREVFEELKGFQNIPYSEDSEFYSRVVKEGYRAEKVDYPTYIYYRDSIDGICNNI